MLVPSTTFIRFIFIIGDKSDAHPFVNTILSTSSLRITSQFIKYQPKAEQAGDSNIMPLRKY
jgi:hypothetical protein